MNTWVYQFLPLIAFSYPVSQWAIQALGHGSYLVGTQIVTVHRCSRRCKFRRTPPTESNLQVIYVALCCSATSHSPQIRLRWPSWARSAAQRLLRVVGGSTGRSRVSTIYSASSLRTCHFALYESRAHSCLRDRNASPGTTARSDHLSRNRHHTPNRWGL